MSGGQGAWIPQTWAICSPLLNLPPYHPELCFSKCQPGPAAAAAAPESLFEMQIETYRSLGVGPAVWLLSPSRWFWCLLLVKRRLSISSESPAPQKITKAPQPTSPCAHHWVEDQEDTREAQTCSLPWRSVLVAGPVGLAASWWPERLWASELPGPGVCEKDRLLSRTKRGSKPLLASHQLNNLSKLCSLGLVRGVKNSDIACMPSKHFFSKNEGWECETKGRSLGPQWYFLWLALKFDHMVPVYLCKHEQVFPSLLSKLLLLYSENRGWRCANPFREPGSVQGTRRVFSSCIFISPFSYMEKDGRHNNDPLTVFTSQSSEHGSTLLHRCSKLRTLKGEFSWIMWVGPV